MISVAFAATGLGKRIAYHLIGIFGKTSLGLGYSLAFTDLTLGLAIPSTTARAGGVVFPIFNNVAKTLGSGSGGRHQPEAWRPICVSSAYHINLVTASVWLTGIGSPTCRSPPLPRIF